MANISIMLQVGMPDSNTSSIAPVLPQKKSVEDTVREALDCIESGWNSHVEWNMIRRLYASLENSTKKSDRIDNLKKMIYPVLQKYGYYPDK